MTLADSLGFLMQILASSPKRLMMVVAATLMAPPRAVVVYVPRSVLTLFTVTMSNVTDLATVVMALVLSWLHVPPGRRCAEMMRHRMPRHQVALAFAGAKARRISEGARDCREGWGAACMHTQWHAGSPCPAAKGEPPTKINVEFLKGT